MNEVGLSNARLQIAARADAPLKGEPVAKTPQDGKALPEPSEVQQSLAANNKQDAEKTPASELNDLVSTVNGYVQSIQRDLQFSVDQELKQTVVKVVDSNSGKLIRQIPEEVFLDLARNLTQKGEFQLVDAQS